MGSSGPLEQVSQRAQRCPGSSPLGPPPPHFPLYWLEKVGLCCNNNKTPQLQRLNTVQIFSRSLYMSSTGVVKGLCSVQVEVLSSTCSPAALEGEGGRGKSGLGS